jgi:hypothetical protein
MDLFIPLSRRLLAGLILSLSLCALAYADNPDGTYRLVMRKLADGTVLTPPAVQGMGTFKNGVYQLIVYWRTPDGKPASLSSLSKWEWSDTEVTAKPLASMFDDGSGKSPIYTVGGETKRVPVARQGQRVSHQHPLDPVFMVWEGDKETATLEGVFTDHWERMK